MRYIKCKKASTAVIFGIISIPLFASVGVAVDFTRASNYKAQLQKAADVSALKMAKAAPTTESDNEVKTIGQNSFYHNRNLTNGLSVQNVNITLDRANSVVTIDTQATYQASISKVIGMETITVNVQSSAIWPDITDPVEIALVLDYSGSMRDGETPNDDDSGDRIRVIRQAVDAFISYFEQINNNGGNVKISAVPYHHSVRVNPADIADPVDFTVGVPANTGITGFGETAVNNYSYLSAPTWNGCITDPDQLQTNIPIFNPDMLIASDCSTKHDENGNLTTHGPIDVPPISPLSDNFTGIRNTFINGNYNDLNDIPMTNQGIISIDQPQNFNNPFASNKLPHPNAYTNLPIGLMWGYETLKTDNVFNANQQGSTDHRTKRFLVFMTDGQNTRSRFYHNDANTNNSQQLDDVTRETCNYIKRDSRVHIITVNILNGDAQLLSSCASEQEDFFEAQTLDDVMVIIKKIQAIILGSVRISK